MKPNLPASSFLYLLLVPFFSMLCYWPSWLLTLAFVPFIFHWCIYNFLTIIWMSCCQIQSSMADNSTTFPFLRLASVRITFRFFKLSSGKMRWMSSPFYSSFATSRVGRKTVNLSVLKRPHEASCSASWDFLKAY